MEDKHKRRNRNRRYMINRTAIQQWSEHAPWIDNAQIEQDLIICRAFGFFFLHPSFLHFALTVLPIGSWSVKVSVCAPTNIGTQSIIRNIILFKSIFINRKLSCQPHVKQITQFLRLYVETICWQRFLNPY